MIEIKNPIVLRKIRFKKIGIFEDFIINFTHPIHIIYGLAGSGKTTVLNVINHIKYALPLNRSEELNTLISKDSFIQYFFAPEFFQLDLNQKDVQITVSYDDIKIEPSSISIEEINFNNLFFFFSTEIFDYNQTSIDPYTSDYFEFDKKLSFGQNWFKYLNSYLEKQFSYKIFLLDDVLAFFDAAHSKSIFDSLISFSTSNQIIFATSRVPPSSLEFQENIEISGVPSDQVWFNEKLRQIIDEKTSIYGEFKNSIQVIKSLMKIEPEDPDLRQKLLYLFHINIITTMETFFTDALIKSVNKEKIVQKRLLSESKEFNEKKYKLSDSIEIFENLKDFIGKVLSKTSFHDIWKVKDLYKKVLNVNFPEKLDAIIKAVNIRHIIVHRNGKNADGSKVIMNANDIYNLISLVEYLIDYVNKQLPFE